MKLVRSSVFYNVSDTIANYLLITTSKINHVLSLFRRRTYSVGRQNICQARRSARTLETEGSCCATVHLLSSVLSDIDKAMNAVER